MCGAPNNLSGDDVDEPNLFGVVPKKRTRKQAPAEGGAVPRLIGLYIREYQARFGEKPVIVKGDGPSLKRLVVAHGAALVEERLPAYIKWDDPFVTESGHPLIQFERQWNRLAAHQRRFKPRGAPDVDATEKYLEELKAHKGK